MSVLNRCPFCGGEVHRVGGDDDTAHDIECDGCAYTFYDISEGNGWWNTRPIEDALRAQLAEAQAENASLRSMMKSEAFEGLSTKQLIFIIHSMQDERGAKCLEYEAVIEKLNEQLSLAGQALTGLGYTPSADDSGSYDSLIPDKYL